MCTRLSGVCTWAPFPSLFLANTPFPPNHPLFVYLFATHAAGSRRPSLASVHSTSSSIKSYSMQRIEKELQQKELRQEMKLRLARLQQSQSVHKPQIIIIGGSGGGDDGDPKGISSAMDAAIMDGGAISGTINGRSNNNNGMISHSSSSVSGVFSVGGMGVGGGGGGVIGGSNGSGLHGRDFMLQQQYQHHSQQQLHHHNHHQQQQPLSASMPYQQYQQHNHHHHHHGVSSMGGSGGSGSGAGGAIASLVGTHLHHHNSQPHPQHSHVAYMVDPLMHQHVVLSKNNATAHTPSPLTPNSTDELLPSVDEAQEVRVTRNNQHLDRSPSPLFAFCSSHHRSPFTVPTTMEPVTVPSLDRACPVMLCSISSLSCTPFSKQTLPDKDSEFCWLSMIDDRYTSLTLSLVFIFSLSLNAL